MRATTAGEDTASPFGIARRDIEAAKNVRGETNCGSEGERGFPIVRNIPDVSRATNGSLGRTSRLRRLDPNSRFSALCSRWPTTRRMGRRCPKAVAPVQAAFLG
jgi:hypothetical protein